MRVSSLRAFRAGRALLATRPISPDDVASRRAWEHRLAAFVQGRREEASQRQQQSFDALYKAKDFTPVEDAFPKRKRRDDDAGDDGAAATADAPVLTQPKDAHVATVAVLGPPNVGKSSLVNALATAHVSAVASRPHSTEDWVRATTTVHSAQIDLVDTPGIEPLRSRKATVAGGATERTKRDPSAGNAVAMDALLVCDAAILVLQAGLGFVEPHHKQVAAHVVAAARARRRPLLLCVNKIDVALKSPYQKQLYRRMRADLDVAFPATDAPTTGRPTDGEDAAAASSAPTASGPFAGVFETSATKFTGIVDLKDELLCYARPGPWRRYRHEAAAMDDADRASGFMREACLQLLPDDTPHRMAHRVVGWTHRKAWRNQPLHVAIEVFFDHPRHQGAFLARAGLVRDAVKGRLVDALRRPVVVSFHPFITPAGLRR